MCGAYSYCIACADTHLSTRLLSFCGANLSLTMRAHSRRAARSLATSSKKLSPTAKKNDRRGATWSTCSPAACAHLQHNMDTRVCGSGLVVQGLGVGQGKKTEEKGQAGATWSP